MITQKQRAIIGFIILFITFNVVIYILSILWGGEKTNLPVAVILTGGLVFITYYKKGKLLRFFKKNRR